MALLDSGAVMAGLIMEIPTGAFADLVGKKKTLMLAFLLHGVGNILMGVSGNFWMLALSLWLFVCAGGAFYSGTMEALIYDSLKVNKEEHLFDRKIGAIRATRLWSMAIASVLGGFAYYISPSLPFILDGVVALVGFVVCFWLVEPKIDTNKYSLLAFFHQNTVGIKSLFSNSYMKKLSIFLIGTGAFGVVTYSLLDDLLAVEYGYSPMGVSILFSVVCLVAGFASIYFPRLNIKFNYRSNLIISMVAMGFLLMLSPWLGMLMSGVFLLIRVIVEVIYDNSASVMVNRHTESKVRATTLSSLSLLQSIPYAVGGTFIGGMILASGSTRNFSFLFGLALMIFTVIWGARMERDKV